MTDMRVMSGVMTTNEMPHFTRIALSYIPQVHFISSTLSGDTFHTSASLQAHCPVIRSARTPDFTRIALCYVLQVRLISR